MKLLYITSIVAALMFAVKWTIVNIRETNFLNTVLSLILLIVLIYLMMATFGVAT